MPCKNAAIWYCRRLMVEVYHDIEKNGSERGGPAFRDGRADGDVFGGGGCAEHSSSVAPWRRNARAPAEQAGTATEIGMIRLFLKHTKGRFTIRDFVRGGEAGGLPGAALRRGTGHPRLVAWLPTLAGHGPQVLAARLHHLAGSVKALRCRRQTSVDGGLVCLWMLPGRGRPSFKRPTSRNPVKRG